MNTINRQELSSTEIEKFSPKKNDGENGCVTPSCTRTDSEAQEEEVITSDVSYTHRNVEVRDSHDSDTEIFPRKKQKTERKYSQRYRPEWECEEVFSGWLKRSAKGQSYAHCIVCNRDLTSGKSELLKHSNAKKHKKNFLKYQNQTVQFEFAHNAGSETSGELNVVCYISEQDGPVNVTDISPGTYISKGHTNLFVARAVMEERYSKIASVKGLISAPFTPFNSEGEVNLDLIPRYIEHLVKNNVRGVFVNGTTGEGVSLTVSERKQIAEKWVTSGKDLLDVIIIQVGTSNIKDSQELAKHAEKVGATAIACLPPLYYKPETEDDLIPYLKAIASSAPHLPFLYYHIPSFNGVEVSLSKLLHEGKQQIPTLCGAKYTSSDSKELLRSLQLGEFKILTGFDDILLSGLPMGVTASVGASCNFMPAPSNNILTAFAAGNEAVAWEEQTYVRQVLDVIGKYGSIISALKAAMNLCGPFNVGEPRLPLIKLTKQQTENLKAELDQMNTLKWYK